VRRQSSIGPGPCTMAPCWAVQSMKPCSNSLRRPPGTDESFAPPGVPGRRGAAGPAS